MPRRAHALRKTNRRDKASRGKDPKGQNSPRNANDHEQKARVHPAQPSYSVVVPAPELSSINVAVENQDRDDRDVSQGAGFPQTLNCQPIGAPL